MIESLKLTNYKTFGQFEVTGLTPFTILGGTNDVGKTSILTAIYIYTARLQPTMRNLALSRSDSTTEWPDSYFHGFKPSPEQPIEIAIAIDQTQCRLTIDYIDAIQPLDLYARPEEQIPPHFLAFTNQEQTAITDPLKIAAQFGLPSGQQTVRALRMRWFENHDCKADIYSILPPATTSQFVKYSIPGKLPNSALILPFMRGITPLLAQALSRLVETGGAAEIIEDVRKLFPHIKGLTPAMASPDRINVFADVGYPQPTPISELGDGVKQALNILLPIPQLANGVLLCDEMAVGIHSSKLPDFVRQAAWMAKKYNCQIIATTHSYELLAAAHNAFSNNDMNPEHLSFFRMDRVDNRAIVATRFDHRSLGHAITENWEVR
jgi:hypothetical protein